MKSVFRVQVMGMRLSVAALGLAISVSAAGQAVSPVSEDPIAQPQRVVSPSSAQPVSLPVESSPAVQTSAAPMGKVSELLDFKDSDIKFNLQTLMSTLRGHEGWVLGAYPDPNTSRPLIGAGFSLDLPERVHLQRDPRNPHPFLEPSSAQLWQAAGLEPARLQRILDQFAIDSSTWSKKIFRKKIRTHALTSQIDSEEATGLLRISAIQAVYNAKAYCRRFDELSGPQQMALSQLVYQMGVNLEQFVHFLDIVNGDATADDMAHWKNVQHSLMTSQWARKYSGRATKVIAMFNPDYFQAPGAAEREIAATLHPAVIRRHHRGHSVTALRVASHSRHAGKKSGKKLHGAQSRRKLT